MVATFATISKFVIDQASHQLEDLERDLHAAQARIRELEQQLNIEKRFLCDTHAYAFRIWVKKRQRTLPTIAAKLLAESWLEPRISRGGYESQLRRAGYSAKEIEAFRDLWKLLLLEHSYL